MDVGLLKRGLIAGLIGATVLALWFLGFDILRGEPLATPIFLASSLLGGPAAAAIPAYTILHYMSFVVVGLGAAWAMDRVRVAAPTLIGLALGFLLFDMIFYGSAMATGADVVGELGWPPVLLGNVVAGLTITHVIHRMEARGRGNWLAAVLKGPVAREGFVLGLAGASVVAVWFLFLDGLDGRMFQTPSSLGGLLLGGGAEAASAAINPTWVLGFTLVHVILFVAFGTILSSLTATMERVPMLLFGVFLGFVSLEALAMGMVAVLSEFLPHAWWTFAGANVLAALAMGALLLRAHPKLVAVLGSDGLASASDGG
jgi:hypothetical protein